ncbi:hypothetical protein [Palleronia caenipelagi]|uniref:Uncharacterized protein n=1 Tax=Palleronia caenipelagi TaxID=2489174 RepID=A0A547PWB4_9RHOB|nr:hypothetical protein [Palleronia caenipelagi]TRD18364.1 hypothetical protein FEV53_11960 [Palleronia caenipelagi]
MRRFVASRVVRFSSVTARHLPGREDLPNEEPGRAFSILVDALGLLCLCAILLGSLALEWGFQ